MKIPVSLFSKTAVVKSLYFYDIFALTIVTIIHLIVFFTHYNGTEIYQWDFTSSVSHAQTVGWFEDGSILNPPNFLPYSSMGFPGWWSIQSGAWYLPLQIIRWCGFKYTFYLASGFQSAHVFLGAVGLYVLSRVCGISKSPSLIAALVFHFSSLFFSNAEHVEIVRATGLLPWMLIGVHPRVLCRYAVMISISALVIQQFLIAAYAGDIVSGFYITAALVTVWTYTGCRQQSARIYLCRVFTAGLAGVLMALIKWLTPGSQMLASFVGKPETQSIKWQHLFTFLFRFGTPNLPNDITMQSLWVPPIIFILLIMINRTSKMLMLGLVIAGVALAMGSLESTAPMLRRVIPGLSFSRLAHSDWRLPLQIGLALASGAVVELFFATKAACRDRSFTRALVAIIVVLITSLLAINVGYTFSEIAFETEILVGFIILAQFWLWMRFSSKPVEVSAFIALCIIFICISSYRQYEVYVPQVWLQPWSKEAEIGTFGQTVSSMIIRPRIKTWAKRPARQTFGVVDTHSVVGQKDIRLNKSYYSQSFTAFGYDNLGSSQYYNFITAYELNPNDPDLLAFANHPSQAVFSPVWQTPSLSVGALCSPEHESCTQGSADVSFSVQNYRLDGATYNLSSVQPVRMMENEPFYPGFFARLCGASGCQTIIPTPSVADLRLWALPAGTWTMTVGYRAPLLTSSVLCSLAGVLLALGSAVPWRKLRVR